MQSWFRSLPLVASLVAAALLGACAGTATTQVTLTPPDQAPVCQPQAALKASVFWRCLLYTSPSPRDRTRSRMPSSA